MRFLSALRRACPISVQQQQQCQQQRVNALWRAYLISTARKERGISHEHAVSMPYIGLLPFLPSICVVRSASEECVNALHRASPISTKPAVVYIFLDIFWCQCPTSGFSHFYRIKTRQLRLLKTVSMPYIGLLPFLQYPLKNLIKSMVSGTVFRG